MRRILHIIDSLGRSGLPKQLLVLSQGLMERGFDTHVAALCGRGTLVPDFKAAGVPIVEIDRRWQHDPITCFRLLRHISRLRPDVVHTWNSDAGIYERIAARVGGVKKLVAGQYCIDPYKSIRNLFADFRSSHQDQRYVSSSIHVREWAVRQGLPAANFTVIPPGVPAAPPSDVSREELLRELKLPADARLIGVIGRLSPGNRVKDLIWAADLLRVLHDSLRLLVIGHGPQRQSLEQYARLASDLDHIRFLGERGDVWRIMPHLDVLWNGAENRKPPISMLEAMAAGVPVIASDTPIHREMVVEDETGYLIPLLERSGRATRARHTDRIFNDRELAARLGEAARHRAAEHFSAEQMVKRYAEMY